MHYYKSTELADTYGVSRRTVTNWVKQAQDGKLELELVDIGNTSYIVKSGVNQITIQSLIQERRKYLNKRSLKTVSPRAEFYTTYNDAQIFDIIHNLNVHQELPLQYSYFGQGAKMWDNFRSNPNTNFDSERLFPAISSFIDTLLTQYDQVNIVDIGVGNGRSAKSLISYLQSIGKLKRYIGIDLSPTMLDIAVRNINEWHNGKIQTERHIRDITIESFGDIISEPPDSNTRKTTTINIVLLMGGMISNFKNPADVLRVIHRSMGPEDIFISGFRLAAPAVKNQLNFINKYQQQVDILLNLIGIDKSLYNTEIGFDEERQIRYGRIRLKHSLQIEFKMQKGTWYVDLAKDDTILTYRAHFNDVFTVPKDLFYDNGFNPLLIAQRLSHESALILADLKK